MLSGRTILADEAVRIGLADELAPPGGALDAAMARAREYAANPTPQLRWIKELLTRNVNETDTIEVQRREARRLFEADASEDHKAAVAAYLARRAGRFAPSSVVAAAPAGGRLSGIGTGWVGA